MRYEFGGLIFGGAYTWRGLFSEFYGIMIIFIIILSMLKKKGNCAGITSFSDYRIMPKIMLA